MSLRDRRKLFLEFFRHHSSTVDCTAYLVLRFTGRVVCRHLF